MAVVRKTDELFDSLSRLETDAYNKVPVGLRNLRYLSDLILNLKLDFALRTKAARILDWAVRNGEPAGFLGGSLLSILRARELRPRESIIAPCVASIMRNLISNETSTSRLESWRYTVTEHGTAGNIYLLSVKNQLQNKLTALRSGLRVVPSELVKPEKEKLGHKKGRFVPVHKQTPKRFPVRHLLG